MDLKKIADIRLEENTTIMVDVQQKYKQELEPQAIELVIALINGTIAGNIAMIQALKLDDQEENLLDIKRLQYFNNSFDGYKFYFERIKAVMV